MVYPWESPMLTWEEYSAAFVWNVLYRSLKYIWFKVSFKAIVSLLTFCLDDLFIHVNGVLKSATIIVLLSISTFGSVNKCFIYFGAPMLGACLLITVTSSWWILSFIILYCLCFLLSFFGLKSVSVTRPTFFCLPFTWIIIFHPFSLGLCFSLELRWVFWRQYIVESCFLIHPATLCLLIGQLSPFIFSEIIDKWEFHPAIWSFVFLVALYLHCFFFLVFLSTILLPVVFYDAFLSFLFLMFCASALDLRFIVNMKFAYNMS